MVHLLFWGHSSPEADPRVGREEGQGPGAAGGGGEPSETRMDNLVS